jgi:hypothetical protein
MDAFVKHELKQEVEHRYPALGIAAGPKLLVAAFTKAAVA